MLLDLPSNDTKRNPQGTLPAAENQLPWTALPPRTVSTVVPSSVRGRVTQRPRSLRVLQTIGWVPKLNGRYAAYPHAVAKPVQCRHFGNDLTSYDYRKLTNGRYIYMKYDARHMAAQSTEMLPSFEVNPAIFNVRFPKKAPIKV